MLYITLIIFDWIYLLHSELISLLLFASLEFITISVFWT